MDKTIILDDGCWYCSLGGKNSRYGSIWINGRNESNHKAMWIACRGPISNGLHVLHTCDYKRCVNPDHLFLGSAQDNMQDKHRKGRHDDRRGANNPAAWLTEEKVRYIKELLRVSSWSQREIGVMFGVSQVTISQIKNGDRWARVK